MSKFFITNKKSLFLNIKKREEASPFEICFINEGEIYGLTTKKLKVDHVNGKKVGDGFVAVTGTMVWGEGKRVDEEILRTIWNGYNGDKQNIRKSCIGNYAVSILKDNIGSVFSDLSGFYNIYYYCKDEVWAISNSLYDLYAILKPELSYDLLSIAEFMSQSSILNGDTIFKEIKRLRGYDYLNFSQNRIECIVDDYQYPLAEGEFNEQVRAYVNFSKDYADKTFKAFGTPTISMTGGLDARMLLASYLSIGIKPDLYYGKGNTFLTNTFDQDLEIDRLYSKKFGLQLFEECWDTPEPFNKFWDKYLDYFGFSYDIYASSDGVMESVFNNPNNYFILGEGGEMLRNLPWVDNRGKEFFALDDYLNEYYAPQGLRESIVDEDNFMKHIRNKYLDICNYYHLDPNHIATRDVFLLCLEHRKTADSQTLNWMNYVRYDSVQMVQYEGLVAARLNYKDTANAKFMLYCQDLMYPEILDVPVFSRCKLREFNREKMAIDFKATFVQTLKGKIRNSLPGFFSFVRKCFYKDMMQKNPVNEKIYKDSLCLYNKLNPLDVFNIERFSDKRDFVKYVMFLYAINKLKNN